MLLIYYTIISFVFIFGASSLEGYDSNIALNSSELGSEELDKGGLFNTGIDLGRFAGFVLFGIGLPESTPTWFSIMFIGWQTLITILTAGFVIASVWDG